MSADKVAANGPPAVRRTPLGGAIDQESPFWIGLALAATLHAALLLAIARSSPRQMGERGGRPDGISVVLVDEADLASKNTFREDGSAAGLAAPAQPAPAPQPPAAKALDAPAPRQTPAPVVESPPPSPPSLADLKSTPLAIDKETLESLSRRNSSPSPQNETDPAIKNRPQPQKKPPLQLTMPNIPVAPGGRSAAVTRPPGATRSGENDDFGRGVIRALRQTMPNSAGQLGRVTVRLLLSGTGNLIDVQLVGSAGIPALDQSVVFAVRQASFPIPPAGATGVDRTFLVTYIYH